MERPRVLAAVLGLLLATAGTAAPDLASSRPGLLFYLSAEQGTTADVAAAGTARPTFDSDVRQIPDGVAGAGLQCGDLQRLAWRAPGNIFAQRGTIAFAWRSRYPTGPTAFPIFRVGYADHSSWDMAWLRIDYNDGGFDAFVTDLGLSRVRVSAPLAPFPSPNEWTRLALAWDERIGVRLFINGRLAAQNDTPAVLDAALDQFGPHSRIISPHNVQSDYNWVRGGDVDEIRIYDRMLPDAEIASLARGAPAHTDSPALVRSLGDPSTAREWSQRYGWEDDRALPLYADAALSVRKVEIHDAYDLKRWWWKAVDGIRETTWPGVYNRSRLPGRLDYDQLPDWDCYVESGRAVTFALPDERWNHIEITGPAWGRMELLPTAVQNETAFNSPSEAVLFSRPRGVFHTVHTLPESLTGRSIRFTNTEPEQPINELGVYYVSAGREPATANKLVYRLAATPTNDTTLAPLVDFIANRFPADERNTLFARPGSAQLSLVSPASPPSTAAAPLPLVHILIPDTWDGLDEGFDGLAIDLPPIVNDAPRGTLIPLNIQIKDPLWPLRNLLDFTFSVRAGEAKTLWLDTRDRLLPPQAGLWLSIASRHPSFGAQSLDGAEIRLIFKPRDAARTEHATDRFTQAKDGYAALVESNPFDARYAMWVRFERDLRDLLRVEPDHALGRIYAAVSSLRAPAPPMAAPAEPPPGVPRWAFLQSQLLGEVKQFALWYIHHRQVAYGDFGGGISDDVDLTNLWPGLALMGCEPATFRRSLHDLLEAAYRNGMFTHGLPTIQADELHSYEEGINCLGQNLLLEYGSPRQIERAMATARGLQRITGVNAAGHRHILTSYYSGARMALEEPWGRAKPHSYLVLHTPELLVDFNGSPAVKRELLEIADGLLAHLPATPAPDDPWPPVIRFADDQEFAPTRANFPSHLFWAAWQWTGEQRYLQPILDRGPKVMRALNANAIDILDLRSSWSQHLAGLTSTPPANDPRAAAPPPSEAARYSKNDHLLWQLTGDKSHLEKLYGDQLAQCALYKYINTEGSLWIDRVGVPTMELQRARLGGVALVRMAPFPGHMVSWSFRAPATEQSVAILVPNATPTHLKILVHNLEAVPVQASMTGWNIEPGIWEITQGIDSRGRDEPDKSVTVRDARFERSRSLDLTFAPRATTVLSLRLKKAGTPYWPRPDLGIDPADVQIGEHELRVTVHSVGSVATPPATVGLRDAAGEVVSSALIPSLPAPIDLEPKTVTVTLPLSGTLSPRAGWSVEIDPAHTLEEITTLNNRVSLVIESSTQP